MRRFFFLISLLGCLLGSVSVGASEFGTPDEAVALVGKAIAYVKQVGIDKAVVEFTDRKSNWVDRDMYLVVINKEGNRIAHGQSVKMVGTSFFETIDVNGKSYGKYLEKALAAGEQSGWLEYYFTDPITKKQMKKASYWEKNGDYTFLCGVYRR